MKLKNVEDIYPLAPTQQGVLFHNLYDPGLAMYFEIITWTIHGEVNIEVFAKAWQSVVDRHPVLRTFFVWDGLDEPLQVVRKQVKLPLTYEDWRGLEPEVQQQQVEEFFAQERARGFDLATPPLMRVALIQLEDNVYRFVWSYHHVVVDGWSSSVIFNDVFQFYEKLARGQELKVEAGRPFRDYIVWLRQQDVAEAERFWRQTLQGFAEPNALGAGNGKASATHTYAEEQLFLTAETSDALQAFARRHQLTLNTLFQGAWAILLNRYSGARDIVFGVAVSGRPPELPEVESMVGMLVNTLPARIEVRRGARLLPWLREIQAQQVTMRKYEYTPLMQIQRWSEVAKGTQLFESIVAFENHPIDTTLSTGSAQAELRDVVHYHNATGYALNVMIEPGRELLLKIMYDVGRFEAATVQQMLKHLQALVESSVANPEAQLDELEMLTADERQQLLQEWSGGRTAYPRESSIQELFEAEVARRPEAVAVIFGEEELTYRELNERANQLAHYLRGLGVGPEVLVGICIERSLELIVGLLGILKAGGAYAPLDPNYPPERLAFLLEDSAAPVLVTQEWFADILPVRWSTIVCIDSDWDQIAASPTDNPDNQNSADSLAYVMYTSGSTGRPKGIGIPHRGVVRLVRNTNYADFGPDETLIQLAPVSFDASTFEVWGSLLNGGRLVVMPPESPSLEELGSALRQHNITTLFLTTGLFHLMVNTQLESLLRLRRLLSGGEVLSPQAVKQIVEADSALTFCDIYGPTENTTYSTFYPVQSADSFGATVPIGKAINNTQVYILDGELRPTPAGVPGELYLGGDGLARGYYNRPELTAERFVPNPFGDVPGARLYRTGDRVRFLPDGNIEFIGRVDYQVKVRGFRIELGEIETVLARHAAVKEVVVEMRGDTPEEKRLIAYVVSKPNPKLSTEELRRYVGEKLPDYMMPNNFVLLERMPLTNNGKVDRKTLPEPDSQRPGSLESYVAPRTEVERQLSEIWSSMLGVELVGVDDNFFELGGNSLLATHFVSAVRTTFRIELPLRCIFDSPTVAGVAEYIDAPAQPEVPSAPVIVRAARDRALPLSFAQRRMWFLNQLEPESAYYNVPLAMRLTGRLDTDALEKAINEVIRRHEVFRTTFATENGEPVQVVNEAVHLALTVEDVSVEGEDRALELAAEESATPFDLSRGPLLRLRLLKLGPQEHVALFTVHHIICDGWSMGVLVREVAALYAAFVEGQPSPLPELPLQYADFAAWQQEWLRGSVLEDQLDYWKKQLDGAPTTLDLPVDKPRPPVQRFRGAREVFSVPKDVAEQLSILSRQEGATLFMTTLAAFNVLLYRYSGQKDILIGTPIANRNRAEIEGLIGFFVNTLVLRARMESDESFLSLLRQTRAITLDAYAHQDLPFEKLVQELQPERDMSRAPLFQAMLVLQNAPQQAFELPGLRLSAFETKSRTAKFDLMLTMAETPDGLQCELEYETDLFEAETIKRMIGNFQVLLESVTRDPLQDVSTIELLTQDQRAQVLEEWNQTDAEYARDRCLHELFELQVDRTPDATCLIGDGLRLTYAEVDQHANQLAHRLTQDGIGPETRVGILMERSAEQAIALLGILKTGACYVPLDPEFPRERLHYIVDDANVALILTQARLANDLPADGPRVMCLDECAAELSQESTARPAANVTSDNLAYVIYTSGSTGRPKGAMLQHRSIVNCLEWMQRTYQLDQRDRFLFKTTLNFDPSIWEFFWPLMVGAQVIVVRPEAQSNPALLVETILRYGATVAYLVPSLLTHFLEEQKLDEISSLRYVICGGESLTHETVERFDERLPGVELHHSYGPTETSIATSETICRVDSPRRITPIGRPLANVRLYVLDGRMQPVPIGATGELYAGGECVGRGYLNRPELTAERFGPDPFASEAGARLYRTGDVVRYLPDGQLEFTGRTDEQVKIRGMRIELGEIEAVLGEQDGVSGAAVIAYSEDDRDKRLVAYVTTEPELVLSVDELRSGLKAQLPDYMVPSTFVMLDQMPLLPSGKINRRELPAPGALAAHQNGYVAPANAVEELLTDIWEEVLGLERVSTADNFFELGGHSLLATRVTSRVREMFGVEFPVRSVFEAPTIRGISRKILAGMLGGELQQSRHITPVPRDGDLPLSFAQERLWFLEQLESAGSAYHIPIVVRIEGQLDVEALQNTLQELVRRHESLRTTFIDVEGEPRQRIAASVNVDLPFVDLSTLPEAERDEAAVRYSSEQAQQTFDLTSGPLLRATLLRLSANTHVLALTLHHIISDGWSVGVFVREAAALYEAYAAGKESPLEELPVQYADYAVWQRDWLRDEVLENQFQYWRNLLRDLPTAIELPTDYPRPPVQSFRGDMITFSLSEELTARLKQISKHEDVTLFMTLLAAFRILLYRSTGQEAIAIGTPIANRQDSATEDLIGFFVNTLALRIDLTGDMTFKELLAHVREVTLGAYAHQDVPFEKLVEQLQPERVRNLHPLFQVMFAMQNAPQSALNLPGLTFDTQEFEHAATRFDLECHMREIDNRLFGQFIFSTDLFRRESAERMLKHFENLLEGITPDARIATLPLFTEAEKRQLLAAWHGPIAEFPHDKCIHQLFEAQVAQTPDDVALVFHEEELTYRELDQRATQLARYLRKQGVGPDMVVGVCTERSVEALVGVLGVLKAGGAYLGLDPAYPQERLQLMLDDARVNVLVTQQRFSSRFEVSDKTQIYIDKDWPEICAEREAELPSGMSTDQLAFVVFTSGSTGRPKGVAITHIALANLITWNTARNTAGPQPRTLQFASLSFDVSFQEIFSTWAAGGTLVVADEEARHDAGALLRVLTEQHIQCVDVPYVMLQYLSEIAMAENVKLPDLRYFIAAGEQLKITPTVRRFFEQLSNCAVDNHYGPSETHVVCTCMLEDPPSTWPELPPIGRPMNNARIYVLDKQMQPVSFGVIGEVYIGGAQLARGYLNQPALTAERFIPDPFSSSEPGRRLYRTGDLARLRADGNFEFIGRNDFQIKLRGYRIELGEVEAALRREQFVREAVVKAHRNALGEVSLVAYLLVEPESTLQTNELQDRLEKQLPPYMIPSAFVLMDEFPLTPSGKLDRRALRATDDLLQASYAGYVAPRTPHEEMVAAIWAEMLNLARVGATDNFFHLGGHSLLATRVMSRVRKAFGIELPLYKLFEAPTVARFTEEIVTALAAEPEQEPLPPIEHLDTDEAPLSYEQERLWVWDQFNPGSTIYNLTNAFRMHGRLDPTALEQTFNEIVRRHDILRTTFEASKEGPRQIVNPWTPILFPVTDLSKLPVDEQEAEMKRQQEMHARHNFDLSRGPLMLVSLLRLSEEEHVVLVTLHHIISDGWSESVLAHEITTLYEAFNASRPSPLSDLPLQYSDFARWQRQWLETRSQTYWMKQLDPLPPAIELPRDYERPDTMSFRGNSIFFNIPPELLANLQALSRRQNVTLYMTLLAAFKTLLHRYSGQTDIVIGGASANRTQVELEKLIGFFVNMLVLRTDVSGDPKFSELLQRVREVTLGAYAHQHTPYSALVTELKVKREWNRNPLFQVLFILQNAPFAEVEVPGLSVSPLPLKSDFSSFDLLISLWERAGGIEGTVAYSEELFKRETIELLFDRYRNLLESIVANPDERLSQLELHGNVEKTDYSLPQFLTDLRPREMDKLLLKIGISGD